jgi:hypothetical protein
LEAPGERILDEAVEETISKLSEKRCEIEDQLCIVFPEESWDQIESLVAEYIAGRLTWSWASLSAEESAMLLDICTAALKLSKLIHKAPLELIERLRITFDPGHGIKSALRPVLFPGVPAPDHMLSSHEVLDWAETCLKLLKSGRRRKKGQKKSTEETNCFLGLLKLQFAKAILQNVDVNPPSYSRFAHLIFDQFPKKYPNRPQSFEAAMKSFQRSKLGQE